MSGGFIFECQYRNRLWRLQPTVFNGQDRLNLWAWYPHPEGWRACKGNEVGLVLSLESAAELRDCLTAHLATFETGKAEAA